MDLPAASPDRGADSTVATPLEEAFLLDRLAASSHVTALDEWRQGDLLEGVNLFWAALPGLDPLTDLTLDGPFAGGWSVTQWEASSDPPPPGASASPESTLGIITSQTCDIAAVGPGSRHGTFQVSPLISLAQLSVARAADVRLGRTVDMVMLTNAPREGEWAADLRISLPVSKSVLFSQSPVHGFSTAKQSQEFAERLAIKVRRVAAHDAISEFLTTDLNKLVKRRRAAGATWVDRIEQFRVRARSGDLLNPVSTEIFAIMLDLRLSAEEMSDLRAWRTEVRGTFRRLTGIGELAPIRFVMLESMKVQDYRESVPMRIPELGQGAFW